MSLNNKNKVCIFINSCDKTHDVATYFLKSFQKYIKNDYFDVFIGINEKKHDKKFKSLNYVFAKKTNWKEETIYQLNQLKKIHGFDHIIHILDDFIFNDYSNLKDINSIIDYYYLKKLKYLCLKKLDECFIVNIFYKLRSKNLISKIREDYPYYTSLQISLWDINYLIKNIRQCKSIWNFEKQQLTKSHHHLNYNFFHYKHVVEKGQWNYGTSNYIKKYIGKFIPGDRTFRRSIFGYQIFYIKKISFFIFGYLIMRIKRN